MEQETPTPEATPPASRASLAKSARTWLIYAVMLIGAWFILMYAVPLLLFPQTPPAPAPDASPAAVQEIPPAVTEAGPEPEIPAPLIAEAPELPPAEAVPAEEQPAPADIPPPPAPEAEAPPPPPAHSSPDPAVMAVLQAQLSQQQADIASLKDSLKAMQDVQRDTLEHLRAYDELKAAVLSGTPFRTELSQFTAKTDDTEPMNDALAQLDEYADTGVPTLSFLQSSFADAATNALRLEQSQDGSFLGRFNARMRGIISIRRVGKEVQGDSLEAQLARAEHKLGKGNVNGALQSLPKNDALDDWRAHAKAYVAAPKALKSLYNALMLRATDAAR